MHVLGQAAACPTHLLKPCGEGSWHHAPLHFLVGLSSCSLLFFPLLAKVTQHGNGDVAVYHLQGAAQSQGEHRHVCIRNLTQSHMVAEMALTSTCS